MFFFRQTHRILRDLKVSSLKGWFQKGSSTNIHKKTASFGFVGNETSSFDLGRVKADLTDKFQLIQVYMSGVCKAEGEAERN